MRLVTRSDFDGLACGALLLEAGIIDSWKFAHPKDLQDGLVEINENDCLANVPFVEGCGLWFDHHSSEHERLELKGKYKGESRITPSCARIIYEYYGGKERFPQFDDMMEAVDKVDSGNLTVEEVMNPTGWILVGFLMDPRTGLGRWRQFSISNYQLMEKLMEADQIYPRGRECDHYRSEGSRSYLYREPLYDLQYVPRTEYFRLDRQRAGRPGLFRGGRVQYPEQNFRCQRRKSDVKI